MPDSRRCLLGAVSVLAMGANLVPMPSAEAAGRARFKAGRPIAKMAPVTSTRSARVPKPPVEAKPAARTTTAVEPAAVWTSGEQERACFRGRRKLWQAGEGWVVKKVNLCP